MNKKELELSNTLKNSIGNIVAVGDNKETKAIANILNSLNTEEFKDINTNNSFLETSNEPLNKLILRDIPDGCINTEDKIIGLEHFISHGYLIDNGNGKKIHGVISLVDNILEMEQKSDESGVPYPIGSNRIKVQTGKERADELFNKFREMFENHSTSINRKGKSKLSIYMENITKTNKEKIFIIVVEADPSEAILIRNEKATQKGITGLKKEIKRMPYLAKLQNKMDQCRTLKDIKGPGLNVPEEYTEISIIDLEVIQEYIKEAMHELQGNISIDYILYNVYHNAVLYKVSDIIQGLIPSMGVGDGVGEITYMSNIGYMICNLIILPRKNTGLKGKLSYKDIKCNEKLKGSLGGNKRKDLKLEVLNDVNLKGYLDMESFNNKYELNFMNSWNYFMGIVDELVKLGLLTTLIERDFVLCTDSPGGMRKPTEEEKFIEPHWIDTLDFVSIGVKITDKGKEHIKLLNRYKNTNGQ